MKAERHDTFDDLVNVTAKSDLFASFIQAETNPIQWLHWLDILDQHTNNQSLSSSTLDSALDPTGSGEQETLRFELRTGKSSATKDSLDSSVKSGNMFGRGLQSSGDKYHQPMKFPEAMVAFAQAAKEIPGWPLMSNKMQMLKCEKCSQEFCSTLNQRRHMRATHRRPLNGDKEDLKKKREQIAAFWDKLDAETACELVRAENLLLMDLSAVSVVSALNTQLQQPSLLLLPQIYIKVATALLDLVQNKTLKVSVKATELFAMLDDASEKNLLCGVTSSSMHRCIFDNEPARVGLETKNLVAALGFLIEYRLVRAWMEDKDVEALRCHKALVEEEEAAQKKRAKLLERKRQKKLRQKEFKDKERKVPASSSGLQELKFDVFPREGEDSLTVSQSSPSSSGNSGLDLHTMEAQQILNGDFDGANKPTNHLEDGQPYEGPDDDFNGTPLISFSYPSSQNLESQDDSLEEGGTRPSTAPMVDGGAGGKDRRQGDFSYFPFHGRQPYSKDKRHSDHQYGNQRLTRAPYGNPAFDFPSRYVHYREKPSAFKRPAPVTGAVWTRKTPQVPAAASQLAENNEGNTNDSAEVSRVQGQLGASETGDHSGSLTVRRPDGLSRALSSDSATSHSSGSISARVVAEEQENADHLEVSVSLHRQVAVANADFARSGALVIGSVTIPLGGAAARNVMNIDADTRSEEKSTTEIKKSLPGKAHSSYVVPEDPPHTPSLDAASTAPRGIISHQSGGRDDTSKNLGLSAQSKPVVVKVWRPVTPGDRNSPRIVSPSAAEVEKSVAAATTPRGGGAGVNISSHLSEADGVADTSEKNNDTFSKGTTSNVLKEDLQHLAGCPLSCHHPEVAGFLLQRWQEAITSADTVYYDGEDGLDGVASG